MRDRLFFLPFVIALVACLFVFRPLYKDINIKELTKDEDSYEITMSQEEFRNAYLDLHAGMNYKDVAKHFKADGRKTTLLDSEYNGKNVYIWKRSNGAYVRAIFDDSNDLIGYECGNLFEPTPEINQAQFNQIKTGMTYKDTTDILGCDGNLVKVSDNGNVEIYIWNGEDDAAKGSITFVNGKVDIIGANGLK